ncbi:MurR/RpiR family transcriptional regulator [Fodinicola acaciae]|uniref:MurR/RpiR family transcriptional regulator n=1 Tax=Fodinicola acaciae TaxID=2681555 RepID=UPI0013D66D57|nr:MurR/RpiR family transcriptional regulator [Fodinicola acaciae]
MAAPTTYDELRKAMTERLGDYAPGQRRIAQAILDDPEGTAFRSIGETAQLAGVHSSSLVRFAASLGLSGYPALVELCRRQLADQAQLVRRFDRAAEGEPSTLLATAAEHDRQNIARTVARVDNDDWQAAVDALAHAPHVHVIGLRKCYGVAHLLAYLVRLVRPGVRQIAPVSGSLVDDLRDLAPEDTLVAISIHRYTADTVRVLKAAAGRGLRTIALTDHPSSPLARLADVTFQVETSGVTVLRSVTAFTVLAQALATAVAVRLGADSRAELLTDEQLLEEFSVYLV